MTDKEFYEHYMKLEDGYHEFVVHGLNGLRRAKSYFWDVAFQNGETKFKEFRVDFATPLHHATQLPQIFYTVYVWTENMDMY